MLDTLTDRPDGTTVPLVLLSAEGLGAWLATQPEPVRTWITAIGFRAKADSVCPVPGADGRLAMVVAGRGPDPLWHLAALPDTLPSATYRLEGAVSTPAVLGWALAGYGFRRYKSDPSGTDAPRPRLVWPDGVDRAAVSRAARATALVRDLINTPARDMGPEQLAAAAADLAQAHGARFSEVVGDALVDAGYPAVHAVGAASARPPRLIELRWGDPAAPPVTLVGKGVCFDTGGLDIKPATAMKLMKKDMGGGAHVLGVAAMVMDRSLPVRLRVIIPAVENSVSGNALRPLDVVRTRTGKTVEIGHTDAEGRVILADALAAAAEEAPQLLIDFATLTGAARAALGTEVPALFTDDEALAAALLAHAAAEADPLWRLPLWPPYRKQIDGKIADLTNDPDGPYGGAITAALFLKEFAGTAPAWAHIDLMAWNTAAKPGRPEGGEAMGLRAVDALIADRFAP